FSRGIGGINLTRLRCGDKFNLQGARTLWQKYRHDSFHPTTLPPFHPSTIESVAHEKKQFVESSSLQSTAATWRRHDSPKQTP
ncbi:MAG: hypothetical protein AAFY20_24500, partial [Cyanobacteria bacterium J06639_14]